MSLVYSGAPRSGERSVKDSKRERASQYIAPVTTEVWSKEKMAAHLAEIKK